MKHEVLPERLINAGNFVTYPWSTYLHKNVSLNWTECIHYVGCSAKLRTSSWLFNTYVQFQDFSGPEKWKLKIQDFWRLFRTRGNPVWHRNNEWCLDHWTTVAALWCVVSPLVLRTRRTFSTKEQWIMYRANVRQCKGSAGQVGRSQLAGAAELNESIEFHGDLKDTQRLNALHVGYNQPGRSVHRKPNVMCRLAHTHKRIQTQYFWLDQSRYIFQPACSLQSHTW